eukprot:scaffold52375_cov17-Prasinocladus_malaysianus.AAC.1
MKWWGPSASKATLGLLQPCAGPTRARSRGTNATGKRLVKWPALNPNNPRGSTSHGTHIQRDAKF